MVMWEYHQEVVALGGVLATCQLAGVDGWELAASIPMLVQQSLLSTDQPQPGAVLIFQRPVTDLSRQRQLKQLRNGHVHAPVEPDRLPDGG